MGRTTVDGWLTEVANNIADAQEPVVDGEGVDQDTDSSDGSATDGDDMNSGDGNSSDDSDEGADPNGGDGGTDTPASPDGATVFANNCAACHGGDGASGFAPNIRGKTVDELLEGLTRAVHSAVVVTDEDVAAVAVFLGE